ncbi:MAG TPA: VOC family protein [Vicinamibacterales bacterium]|jgi:predicted enzyme related to lactoylglutathione lyase
MPDVDSLPAGSFCWPELATSDQKAGTSFYAKLFGWSQNDHDMGPAGVYTVFQMRSRDVAAATSLRPEEKQHGVPAHWNTYISVANADDAVKRAHALGAKVLAPPFDVMEDGRMAVLADPTGAVFQVWQPKKTVGTRIQGENGALCWSELYTHDTMAAESFYKQLFGWTAKTGGAPPYTEYHLDGRGVGGMMAIQPEWGKMPPNWVPYFMVANCDASADKAKSLGANVGVKPTDIPNVGRFAMVADPQGALFAIFTPSRK